ncbi:MAG: hypothetical protein RIG27_01040 [Coleofasciculus sp. F4-SAH-05]
MGEPDPIGTRQPRRNPNPRLNRQPERKRDRTLSMAPYVTVALIYFPASVSGDFFSHQFIYPPTFPRSNRLVLETETN